MANRLTESAEMLLICGRYEGVDERVAEHLADEEISIGNYVLSGGELAAAVVIDTVARLMPGVLGNEASSAFESFQDTGHGEGLLDCPHWTRPAEFRGWKAPEVLLGGNHEEIRKFRQEDRAGEDGEAAAGFTEVAGQAACRDSRSRSAYQRPSPEPSRGAYRIDPRAFALHGGFHFFERRHAGVAGRGHGQRAVGRAVLHRLLRGLAGEEPVGEAGGEAVAAADAVEDFQILAQRRFVEFAVRSRGSRPNR